MSKKKEWYKNPLIFIKYCSLEVNMHLLTVTDLFCRFFPIVLQYMYFVQAGNPTAKIQLNQSSKIWGKNPLKFINL